MVALTMNNIMDSDVICRYRCMCSVGSAGHMDVCVCVSWR